MRFTVAAAVMATGAMAAAEVSTAYTTEMITIISCAPTVTNCPADQTHVTSTVLPLTTSTVYSTKVHTITSCAPGVVKCPAASTVVSTETVAVSTTVCPVTATETPESPETTGDNSAEEPSSSVPYVAITTPSYNGTWPGSPAGSSSVVYVPPTTPSASEEQCVPSSSVVAITKSYTTVYTSVEYSTIEVPCSGVATETAAVPPVSSAAGNSTVPYTVPATTPTSSVPEVTGAAGAVAGSAFFAAAAGLAALVLA